MTYSCNDNVISGRNDYFPNIFSLFHFPENGSINFMGFHFTYEDFLIISLAFYLFVQDSCDYLLIGTLVMLLFN